METKEIMNNEEVMDTTEEIVKTASKGGFSKVTTIGVAMIAGGLAYKFVVAPAVSKLKKMKAQKKDFFCSFLLRYSKFCLR